jgi:hypothetical protein
MAGPTEEEVASLEPHVCGPEDRAEQARLFNRCFKKRIEPSDLAWRYDQNPHGGAASLVYRPPGEEAVCSFAYMPRQALVFGGEQSAGLIGQQGDVMTDPGWRRRGLVMTLSEHCARETALRGWPLNWGFPNRQSASVFLKLGWKSVGNIRPWDFYFTAGREARKLRIREGRLPSLLLPLHRHRCRRGWQGLRDLAGSKFEARPLVVFPDEVTELSKEIERRYCFMVRRDAAYLNWRFLNTPSKMHRAFGIYDAGGTFRGYTVIQEPREGSGVGYVVDLLAADEPAQAAALSTALAQLEGGSALLARATAVDDSWWAGILQSAGFLPPKPENHLYVYVFIQDEDHPLAKEALDASKWYLTDGDRDDETMG